MSELDRAEQNLERMRPRLREIRAPEVFGRASPLRTEGDRKDCGEELDDFAAGRAYEARERP